MAAATTATMKSGRGMVERGVLLSRRSALEREWSRWVPRLRAPHRSTCAAVRSEVAESWARSLPTVDPARQSAPVSADGNVHHRWLHSALHQPVMELADELRSIADDAGFVAAVTDESGTILWTCGGRVMRRKAEQVNFAPGGRWDEPDMGTNALSLALVTGVPSTVFSAEHLVAALHGWVCYCVPIRDQSERILGVLDLSTTWDRSHPLAMSTARTLASTIEHRLRTRRAGGESPAGVRLTCLGVAAARRSGEPLPLRPRQLEILTLLALEPGGFTPETLRQALYGDRPVSMTTIKAEVSHLRHTLGGGLANRRYALTTPISCDAADVLAALRRGDSTAAVCGYTGRLLPESEAPGIVQWRDYLEVALREAVLASSQPEHALRLGEHTPHDAEVHEHALDILGPGDPRRAIAAGRLSVARAE